LHLRWCFVSSTQLAAHTPAARRRALAHLHRQRQPRSALQQDDLRLVQHVLDVRLAPAHQGGRLPLALGHEFEVHVLVAHAQQVVALPSHQVEAAGGGGKQR
jgi:hypothetical protein